MSQMGVTFSNALLNFIFNSVDPTPDGSALSANLGAAAMSTPLATTKFYLSLHKQHPGYGGTQGQQQPTQAEYPGYARFEINRGTIGTPGTSWTVASRNASNSGAITWPTVGSGAPGNVTVDHVGIGFRDLPLSAVSIGFFPIMPVGEAIRVAVSSAPSSTPGGHVFTCDSHGYVDGDTVALYFAGLSVNFPVSLSNLGLRRYVERLSAHTFRLHTLPGLGSELSVPNVDCCLVAKLSPIIIADGVTPTVTAGNGNIRQV